MNRSEIQSPSHRLTAEKLRIDRQTFLVGSFAVAALLAIAVLVLSSLTFSPDRGTDEFRLVVHQSAPGTIDDTFLPGVKPKRPVFPFEGEVSPVATTARVDTIELSAGNAIPHIESFPPSLESFPEKADRERRFRISADRIERNGDSIYYSGNVVLEHSEFRIEAARVRVEKGGSGGPEISAAVARVEQSAADRSVSAANLTFDPIASEIRLIGVARFSTGGKNQELNADDVLILSATAYTVEDARTIHYASPVK